MRALESAILAEAREVTGRKGLRLKDILEWTTSPMDPSEGEVVYHLPVIGVYVAVKAA